MRSYSFKCFTLEDLEFWARATHLVEAIPDTMDKPIRCHEVARAVGRILDLPVVDGHYGAVDHSWLMTRTRSNKPKILDVYSVGRLPQVQLLVLDPGTSHTTIFRPGPYRTDIRNDVVEHMVGFFLVESL